MVTVTTNTATTTTDASANSSALGLSADYQMFLKLLTTQMQNQDPLDPMDSSEYTQQLVQYSQVEQSIQQTTTLKNILNQLGSQDLTQASSMIGQNVQVDTDVSGLTADAPAQWNWAATRNVTTITATIRDASGNVVATQDLNPDGTATGTFTWDGTKTNGSKATDGNYSVSFAGKDASGLDVTVASNTVGKVTDVMMISGAVYVTVNGAQMPVTLLQKIG